MKFSTIGRHFREGFKNVIRNAWMSFASISSIAIPLFILGVFLLLTSNVDEFLNDLESQVEVKVFLHTEVPQDEILSIKNKIATIDEIKRVTHITKEQGMADLRERIGDPLEGYDGEENPLPDSFVVEVYQPREVKTAAEKIESLFENEFITIERAISDEVDQSDESTTTDGENTAEEQTPEESTTEGTATDEESITEEPLTQDTEIPVIESVKYGQGYVEKLLTITNTIRLIGFIIVIGLVFTAMFLIANTIKLTIMSRSSEVEIMKLVGATNQFIRWPFFIEGAVIGVIGSFIPSAILYFGYSGLEQRSELQLGILGIKMIPVNEATPQILMVLFAIGIVIGVFGSLLSIRKHLKV
ncbi:permease-like cell division protein FtsX [Chengkuizengella axinellae]|uniref:Cell division protein FtsX n=1 Tax=Chengkuizengella axinellae TaxID=3064388 RepID=A0ABT9J2T7_9BACL|nr:permease-like cell division protein FtsX [Chengkuizengella sp. 2205SS18-9]MDP5275914.1 permease-like cell division protein FtsX [Chengkuizengella sp. 2205SS18-9]